MFEKKVFIIACAQRNIKRKSPGAKYFWSKIEKRKFKQNLICEYNK